MTLMDGICDMESWTDSGLKVRCKEGKPNDASFICPMFNHTFCKEHAPEHNRLTQHRMLPYSPLVENKPKKGLDVFQ